MKRKIIIGLMIFFLVFISSGFYIITNIEKVTSSLDGLILLHQVEIIRERLLVELKRTQLDLQLRNTQHARSGDTIVTHVKALSDLVNVCFECHHTAQVTARLDSLQTSIDAYKNALSRVFTMRANKQRLVSEQENAFEISSEIVAEVININDLTTKKLRSSTTAALDDTRNMKVFLYTILITAPVSALVLSLLFLRWFTRPVSVLVHAIRQLRSGDLSYRIDGLHDEYIEVADSFNTMAVSLKEHYDRMQWAEQVVILGELAGGLAHEIKNPLAGVKASMEILSTDPAVSEENKDVLTKAAEQVKRMEALIKSFMNFARPPAPQLADTNIHAVLESTLALAQRHPLFGKSRVGRITVVKNFDDQLPSILADPAQMQQVFLNLLLNAADEMPDGGTITITTQFESEMECLTIRIRDTGKGVDDGLREKIFQPFFTTKAKGTGLGLSISKRLVEQQGGGIRIENHNGNGVSFIIAFPLFTRTEVPVP
ncbi:MAG: ATP-binding protein [Nitrospirota bacterium]